MTLSVLVLICCAQVVLAQDTHLLVITGVEGDAEHGERFHKWAAAILDAAKRGNALADANVSYLGDKPERDPRIRARATKENVEHAFADLARRVRPSDEVLVVLIGHGSFDGRQASFNLPGPDLTAADYGRLLDQVHSSRVVFVNTSSSSGGFLQALTGPGRTIVTATRTGGERNETRFPEFFAASFTDPAADRNRDGRVSMAEAFEYARTKVVQAYEKDGLLLTEHATLEDGQNGAVASTEFLTPDKAEVEATSNPALRALIDERRALEDQVAALRLRKAGMDAAQYDAELEKLLTALAQKTRQIQQMQDKKP